MTSHDPIATRDERQRHLTAIMRNDGEKAVDRIKAIEIFAKMEGDFTERVEHSGDMTFRWAKTPAEADANA